ncbi:MAG: hypothetical protein JWM14_2422 [Chitinophagaceae bacterium]|nr:hypothetical protein [Chitinophagaceae bacterium]
MEKVQYTRLTKYFSFIACFILTGIFSSCAKYIDDPTPVDTTKRWLAYRQNVDDTISVKDGYVYLSTHNAISANGTSIASNNKFKGDFEVKISYSSFVASGNYSFSDQLIFNFSSPDIQNPLIAAFLTNDEIYLQDSTRTGVSKSSTNRAGEVYVKREGSTIYSWIRAGDDSLFFNKTNYYSEDVSLEVKVYSADNTTAHTSVHLDDIVVVGGGGFVKSNAFDENTIDFIQ